MYIDVSGLGHFLETDTVKSEVDSESYLLKTFLLGPVWWHSVLILFLWHSIPIWTSPGCSMSDPAPR